MCRKIDTVHIANGSQDEVRLGLAGTRCADTLYLRKDCGKFTIIPQLYVLSAAGILHEILLSTSTPRAEPHIVALPL